MNHMVNSEELLLDEVGEIQATKPELGTILVVEDDPRMQKVLKRIFTEESYSIDVAGDGKTGLELFRSHRPVAVVLDSDPSADLWARVVPDNEVDCSGYSGDRAECDH